MKFLRFFLIMIMFLSSCLAINESEIKVTVMNKTNEALMVLKKPDISSDEKIIKLCEIFDPMFDYKQMAKISLGRKFISLTPKQQDEFSKAFEENLKNSYVDKVKGYSGQGIVFKEETRPNQNRYWLKGEITNGNDKYEFVYKFYDSKDRGWLVYDIDIVGVSIIQTYRSQFGDVLNNGDFTTLMQKLNKANLK